MDAAAHLIPRAGPPPTANETPAQAANLAGADFEKYKQANGNAGPAPAQRYVVQCAKASGARVAFNAYDTRSIADSVAAHLHAVGCLATVEVMS